MRLGLDLRIRLVPAHLLPHDVLHELCVELVTVWLGGRVGPLREGDQGERRQSRL